MQVIKRTVKKILSWPERCTDLMTSWTRPLKASVGDILALASSFVLMTSFCPHPAGELAVRHEKILQKSWRSPVVKLSKVCLLTLLPWLVLSSGTNNYNKNRNVTIFLCAVCNVTKINHL